MKLKEFRIEKGGLVFESGGWYIIVEIVYTNDKVYIHCICDNANNVYSFEPSKVDYIACKDEILADSFGRASDKFRELKMEREIPYQKLYEILSGDQDNRFGNWNSEYKLVKELE